MSWNLVISDSRHNGPKLVLTRANVGITNSGMIAKDDLITFEDTDITAIVVEIMHRWERPGTLIAPNSTAQCVVNGFLTYEEWNKLKAIGFKDIT